MAGRVQLATTGSQDDYFTVNPEYTQFIDKFKKHTNFAMYDVKAKLEGEIDYGKTLRCTIDNDSGDLLKGVRLHIELSELLHSGTYRKYTESIGHAIIEYVDIFIGGQRIQRVHRDWLQIYSEQYITQTKQTNLDKLIGKCPNEVSGSPVSTHVDGYLDNATAPRTFIVDIPFFFHDNPQLALPLCALKVHEIDIEIKLSEKDRCLHNWVGITDNSGSPDNTTFTVTVDTTNGNKYAIDSNVQSTLTLIRGNTYNFSYPTGNATHPFRLSTKPEGGRLEYPVIVSNYILGGQDLPSQGDGVTQSSETLLVYTVPDDAPDTIYYICKNHVGMGGMIKIIEPYFDPSKATINDFSLYTEMVQLNPPEREKYEKRDIDFVITQTQRNTFQIPVDSAVGTKEHTFKLELVNPVKELFFIVARNGLKYSVFDYDHGDLIYPPNTGTYINYENLVSMEMDLDKETALDKVSGSLINLRAVQSGIHHTRTQLFRRFYSYSFALEPERWYPTGQRNFSAIKEQYITATLNNNVHEKRELRVYALSYNILRIKDGGARLIFQNGSIGD